MPLLHPSSLAATLDALAEAMFFQVRIPAAERRAAVEWIADRQGQTGAYAGMFAPTPQDLKGIRLFTGERVSSRAGIAHCLGEEACRILQALPAPSPAAQAALQRATVGMSARLEEAERRGQSTAIYCCGTCSAGYWRNLKTALFPRAEERLREGLRLLKTHRCGAGQWSRFPFYHTSLALTDLGPELAGDEMRYAAERWRQLLPRLGRTADRFARRRIAVGRRLLELCA